VRLKRARGPLPKSASPAVLLPRAFFPLSGDPELPERRPRGNQEDRAVAATLAFTTLHRDLKGRSARSVPPRGRSEDEQLIRRINGPPHSSINRAC